jgi:hypothetical protein
LEMNLRGKTASNLRASRGPQHQVPGLLRRNKSALWSLLKWLYFIDL